jgi:putative transposase
MIQRRKSIRLQGYDYSQEGCYFVTIVTHGRERLFGDITNGKMVLSKSGKIVENEWIKTPFIRHEIQLGEFAIMPNHFHAIVYIDSPDVEIPFVVGAYGHTPLQEFKSPFRSPSRTLGALVRGFKGSVTQLINLSRGTPGVSVWQRNYYNHIIGTEKEYENTTRYIYDNPMNWLKDEEYLS